MGKWSVPVVTLLGVVLMPWAASAQLSSFSEGFNNVSSMTGNGWFFQNNSQALGTTGWFQGISGIFPAFSGSPTWYIAANSRNAGDGPGSDTISNWMLTPELNLFSGGIVTFWTRTVSSVNFPDRLQVRYSTNGSSTNVGTLATDVGDFTNLLLDINPTYSVSGYPNVWTQYTLNIPATFSNGRLAFRYFVEDGGPAGSRSDYIGIDSLEFVSVPEPSAITLVSLFGIGGGGFYQLLRKWKARCARRR